MKRSLNKRLALLLGALLFHVPAFAQWSPFDWAEISGFAKGAISLPVELDGIHCHMQLDTGSPTSVLYRNALPAKFSADLGREQLAVAQLRVGAERSARSLALMYAARPGGQPAGCDSVVGTIGDDYLLGARLTLDLPRARFQIRRGPEPERKDGGVGSHVLDMELLAYPGFGNVMPAINLTLADGHAVKLLLDTGSASIDINVYLKRNWLELVGMNDLAGAHVHTIPRWGALISCYDAPTRQAALFGGAVILNAGATATFCDDPRAQQSEQNAVYGVIGMAAFLDNRITLDYAAGKLIVEPSPAPE